MVVTIANFISSSVLRFVTLKYLQFSTSNAPAAPCGVELNTAIVVVLECAQVNILSNISTTPVVVIVFDEPLGVPLIVTFSLIVVTKSVSYTHLTLPTKRIV